MVVDQAEEQVRLLSNTDELTETFNRRYFLHIAGQEFERARRYKVTPFSIAIMDFDKFKDINDGYGHLAGDLVLKHVSHICRRLLRSVDTFARYGGDEFVFLLPETNEKQAVECLTRILDTVRREPFVYSDHSIFLSVSIGVAVFSDDMESLDDLLKKADEALYRIKKHGGSQLGTSAILDKA
jgi:diguanylate cyclase (GGDEF)-like protein